MNTPSPYETHSASDIKRYAEEYRDSRIATLERELAEAKELLREIRDGEVNPEDEADKFLRDHVCSELSKSKEREERLRAHIQEAADKAEWAEGVADSDASARAWAREHQWHLAALEQK